MTAILNGPYDTDGVCTATLASLGNNVLSIIKPIALYRQVPWQMLCAVTWQLPRNEFFTFSNMAFTHFKA